MNLLVVTPTKEELLGLLPPKYHPIMAELEQQRPIAASTGLFGRNNVFYCITGIGPINAALAIGLCLATLAQTPNKPDHILLAGLAGAYDLERTQLCTLCRIKEEIWPEYGLHDGHSVIAKAFKWPQWAESPYGPIYDRIHLTEELFSDKALKQLQCCSSLTVAGVSASFQRARDLWDQYHVELENMEGFAVAYAAARLCIPCTEIRSVSNKVGPRKAEEKNFPDALRSLEQILPTLNLI